MDAHVSREDRFAHECAAAADRWCGSPIVYGRDDCLMALAAIVLAVTAKDTAAEYRGRYRTKAGAARVLGAAGVPGAMLKGAKALRYVRIAPETARPGALGVVKAAEGFAGVIYDGASWLGRVDNGFSSLPHAAVSVAWGPKCRR